MIKPQQFVINIGVYRREILVCINYSDEEVESAVIEWGVDEQKAKEVATTRDFAALAYILDNRDCVIRLDATEINPKFHDHVAHEISHCAFAILDYVGIKLGNKSEEAYAYLIGYITREFYEKLSVECNLIQIHT